MMQDLQTFNDVISQGNWILQGNLWSRKSTEGNFLPGMLTDSFSQVTQTEWPRAKNTDERPSQRSSWQRSYSGIWRRVFCKVH